MEATVLNLNSWTRDPQQVESDTVVAWHTEILKTLSTEFQFALPLSWAIAEIVSRHAYVTWLKSLILSSDKRKRFEMNLTAISALGVLNLKINNA